MEPLTSEDIEHILVHCEALADTRTALADFTIIHSETYPKVADSVNDIFSPKNPLFPTHSKNKHIKGSYIGNINVFSCIMNILVSFILQFRERMHYCSWV